MNLNKVKIKSHCEGDNLEELEGILDSLPIDITCKSENVEIEAHWSGGKHLHLNCPEGHVYRIRIGKGMLLGGSSQYSTTLFDVREKLKDVYSRQIHILTGGYKQPPSIFPIFSPL
ncbi:MAG TPA: hypothetical protein VJG31_03615 [Candidatus Nanoarchaeia archaeon]|nr:hypothetical protein [Candidatus Nanoarchaeia archaeon]